MLFSLCSNDQEMLTLSDVTPRESSPLFLKTYTAGILVFEVALLF